MPLTQLLREHLYRALVDHPESLMCAHSLEGTLLFVNSTIAARVGYAPKDMVGDSVRSYLPPDRHDQFDAYLRRVAGETPVSGILCLRHRDGSHVHIAYQNFRIDTADRPYVIGYGIDVSAHYR
jgi:PAS domain S-box-containing protein